MHGHMKKKELFFLIAILIIGFVFRLYRINNPLADWHAWRQADTSAVSRNFVKHGYDILHPMYDDISNIQTGFDNPNGYRFVEFPIFNVFQAGLFQFVGLFTLEEWGRLVTVFSSLIALVFIFLLGKRFGNTTIGFAAAAFYALDPYSVYYGRVVLPDPSMVTAVLGGIYFFDLWSEQGSKLQSNIKNYFLFIIAILFVSLAFLLKPYAVFFTLPLLYIAWRRFGLGLFKQWKLYVFIILSVIPIVLWRWWILHYPEGIPVYAWLFNGNHIRFTGAFFYWLFAERISKLILGYWGIAIILFGFLNTRRKDYGFFLSMLLSSMIYLTVIATGNVQHDYYQILIIPTIAFFFGLGADFLLHPHKEYPKYVTYPLFIISTVCVLAFGWYQIRDYFNINNMAIVTTGQAVDKIIPLNAKVIAPLDGDTSFLYYTNRKGWPAYEHDPAELIQKGADYLVLVHPSSDDFTRFGKYRIVAQTSDFVLFDLHNKSI